MHLYRDLPNSQIYLTDKRETLVHIVHIYTCILFLIVCLLCHIYAFNNKRIIFKISWNMISLSTFVYDTCVFSSLLYRSVLQFAVQRDDALCGHGPSGNHTSYSCLAGNLLIVCVCRLWYAKCILLCRTFLVRLIECHSLPEQNGGCTYIFNSVLFIHTFNIKNAAPTINPLSANN